MLSVRAVYVFSSLQVTIKGKEFHQVSVPSREAVGGFRTFKDGNEAWRFFLAVQDERGPPGS